MRLTRSHAQFWLYHRGPKWAPKPKPVPSIHACINDHVPQYPDATFSAFQDEPGNTLSILRLTRKRESVRASLLRMMAKPGTVTHPARRAAFCKKWLARINQQQKRCAWCGKRLREGFTPESSGICRFCKKAVLSNLEGGGLS